MLPTIQTEVRITRAEFEAMIRPSLVDSIAALHRALQSAQVEPGQIDAVLLVGGSSRIPLVAQLVSAEIGRPVAVDAHPKHAIALGAAHAAALASGAETLPTSADPGGPGVAGVAAAATIAAAPPPAAPPPAAPPPPEPVAPAPPDRSHPPPSPNPYPGPRRQPHPPVHRRRPRRRAHRSRAATDG